MTDILFWAVTFALAFAVIALMFVAVLRGGAARDAETSDLRVYKDQLRDVERDLGRDLITPDDAQRLRTEIGRKVLAADAAAQRSEAQVLRGPPRAFSLALMAVVVLATAFGIYIRRGHPGYGDQPIAARMAAAGAERAARPGQSVLEERAAAARPAPAATPDPRHADLVAELRRAMATRPDDLEGLRLLAHNEALLGNFAASARARTQISTLQGDAVALSDLEAEADSLVMAAGGRVSPEAEGVLSKILTRDPKSGLARYYSGLSLAQTGRYDLAFRFWAPLWADSQADDPWVTVLQKELPDLAWAAGQHRYEMPALRAATRGPDAAAIAAAEGLSAEDRAAMVRGMVDGLMARLAAEGGSAQEWTQLITALGVLGDKDRGRAILLEARERFVSHPEDLARINAAGEQAGFGE